MQMIDNSVTKSYVVEGATLECSLGSTPSKLMLPIGHGVYIWDKKQANISDMKSLYNILPFGVCKGSEPCVPAVVIYWVNGKEDVFIDKHNALVDTSIAFCARGGVIKVTDDGQL